METRAETSASSASEPVRKYVFFAKHLIGFRILLKGINAAEHLLTYGIDRGHDLQRVRVVRVSRILRLVCSDRALGFYYQVEVV